MLEALRNATGGWIAKIFIGLLVMSFAVWGVADIFGGYGATTVATVDDTEISSADYQAEFQREMRSLSNRLGRNVNFDEATKMGLNTQVLLRLIGDAAIESQAKSLGLGITGKAVTGRLMRESAFKGADGRFSQERYYQLLQANGLTEQEFLTRQHRAMILGQLTETVLSSTLVPRTVLEVTNKFRNETRKLRYFAAPLARLGEIGEASEEKLRDYYNTHKSEFRAPEFRKVGMISFKPEVLIKKIEVSDSDIKAYFEQNKARYGTPERRAFLQIPFPDEAAAKEAYEKLKNGADFIEVAKERGLVKGDIEFGLTAKDGVADEAVADVIFALPVNEISKPVKGGFATVVAKVTKIEPAVIKTLEDERGNIRKILAGERVAERILDAYDKIEDERAGGSTLAEVAKKLDLKYIEIAEVDLSGRDGDGRLVGEFALQRAALQAVFQAEVGLESEPVETPGQGYIWFDVLKITPERLKAFNEVKEAAVAKWRKNEERALMSKKGQELVDKLRAGEKLTDLAGTFGAEVKETRALKRSDSGDGLPNAVIQQAFALKQGAFGSATATDGKSRIIFEVAETKQPGSLNADVRQKIKAAIIPEIGDDLIIQYVRGLRDSFSVNINQQVFDDATAGRAFSGQRGGPRNHVF